MMNIQKMMQQAQQMQFKMQELQEKLKDIIVSGESGGGLVKASMGCDGTLRGLEIDPSLIIPEEKETLEDLIVAAVNNANEAKAARAQEETRKIMAALGLPTDAKLPF